MFSRRALRDTQLLGNHLQTVHKPQNPRDGSTFRVYIYDVQMTDHARPKVKNLMRLHAKFFFEVSVNDLCLFLLSVVFDEVFGLFSSYRVDMTDFVSEFYAVKLISGL